MRMRATILEPRSRQATWLHKRFACARDARMAMNTTRTMHTNRIDPTDARLMASWTEVLDLRAIADAHGTPLYLHHPDTLRRAFDAYAAIVGAAGVRYPVKANPSPVVLEAIARHGGGADCAARTEVTAALAAGIPLARISYNTPAPSIAQAAWLLRHGATVVADSAAVLRDLADAVGEDEVTGRLFVRVNPGRLPGYLAVAEHQRYTAHGDPRSQFGLPSEDLIEVLAATHLPISGLHVHVGTMMDNLAAFADGLAFLHELADRVTAGTAHRPTTINLGGGLGLPHDRSQRHPTIAALGSRLRPLLRPDMTYEVEPGNSLVGDSFALLTRLAAVKRVRGRAWGICDVGTDQLVKHTVAGWRHEIVDSAGRALPTDGPDALAGPLCFAGDVLLPATRLGGFEAGEPLLIRHAGAYCEAIASRFNGRLGPATAIVADGRVVRVDRASEDAFFAAAGTSTRPIAPMAQAPGDDDAIPATRIAALQSAYMHREARDDGYAIASARRIGPRCYEFQVDVDAPCGFVGMPLAVRILGDASIVAIGLELGWQSKRGAVLANKLTLACDAMLPGGGRLPVRVAVTALSPAGRDGTALGGAVRFELGEAGAVRGSAQVSAPRA
jgi:diaminopimelate decarboxylase